MKVSPRTTTPGCAPSSTSSASTTNSCRRPPATRRGGSMPRCSRCWSGSTQVMAIMLPSLREERAQTYSPFLPISPRDRRRAAGAGGRARRQGRHDHLRGPRRRRAGDHAGHRRPLQAAVEAGLGDALARARRRLRNGRQGSDRFGQALGRNLPRARRRCRRKVSTTSFFSTRTARRSRSRRATA